MEDSRDASITSIIDFSRLPPELVYLAQANSWSYVGEGNRHLVVRLRKDCGPDLKALNRLVLRIPKYLEGDSIAAGSEEEERRRVLEGIKFSEFLVSNLLDLPKCHAARVPVSLPFSFLKDLEAEMEPVRPESRKAGRLAGPSRKGTWNAIWATLATDHLTLPEPSNPAFETIAVEIKPKWGFLPFSDWAQDKPVPFITPEEAKTKRTVCRYCMHSFLRHKKLPLYCPLDLYSGDRGRKLRALSGLVAEASQDAGFNNLRLFVNGAKVNPETLIEMFCGVGGTTHWTNFYGSREIVVEDAGSRFLDVVSDILDTSGVLKSLSEHQQSLAPLDISAIRAIYDVFAPSRDVKKGPDGIPSDNPLTSTLIEAVARYLHEDRSERSRWAEMSETELLVMDIAEMRELLARFSCSMTLRDVSVLIAIQRAAESIRPDQMDSATLLDSRTKILTSLVAADRSATFSLGAEGTEFLATVRVVDTDPKSLSKVPHWHELDREVLNNWLLEGADSVRSCQ